MLVRQKKNTFISWGDCDTDHGTFIIAQAPKTIKIYANRQTLGFDDADSIKETQTLELEPKDFEDDAVVNLRFVKFQNITSLVVCILRERERGDIDLRVKLILFAIIVVCCR